MRNRIYRRKNVWYLDFSSDGVRIRKRVGSKRDAEKALAIRVGESLRGEYRLTNVIDTRFKDFAPEYLEFVKQKGRFWKRHEASLKNLLPHFGEKLLARITGEDIESYKRDREQKVKGSTINRELSCLSHVFTVAKKKKLFFGDNPVVRDDHFFAEPRRERPVLDAEERENLLQKAGETAPHTVLAITIGLNTGLRRAEILGLKWRNVDFENRVIYVERTKGGEPHRLPMNQTLFDALSKAPREAEFVFWNSLTKAPIRDIKRSFARARKEAGLPDFRFHDTRHCAGTYAHRAGVPTGTIQKMLHHGSIKTTERYLHILDQDLKQATDVLSSEFSKSPKDQGTNRAQKAEVEVPSYSFETNKPGRA